MTMITSNGNLPREMCYSELKREAKIQSWFARQMKRMADIEEYKYHRDIKKIEEENREAQILSDYENGVIDSITKRNRMIGVKRQKDAAELKLYKAAFTRILSEATMLFVMEIEDCLETKKPKRKTRKKWLNQPHKKLPPQPKRLKTKHELRQEAKWNTVRKYLALIDRNGEVFQWDKRKLMLVAKDRGYMSEIAVAYAIEKELDYPKYAVQKLLDTGKFTWGQVLILGALFEMTPKEFCDVFLSGYFLENGNEWRASYQNLDKDGLLSSAIIGMKSKVRDMKEINNRKGTTTE